MTEVDAPDSAFAAPWEARAFAMVRALLDRGVISPHDWAAALGAQSASAEASIDDSPAERSQYGPWLAALEQLVVEKQLVSADALTTRRAAWQRAVRRTPHGMPITLCADDFRD